MGDRRRLQVEPNQFDSHSPVVGEDTKFRFIQQPRCLLWHVILKVSPSFVLVDAAKQDEPQLPACRGIRYFMFTDESKLEYLLSKAKDNRSTCYQYFWSLFTFRPRCFSTAGTPCIIRYFTVSHSSGSVPLVLPELAAS